MRVPPGEELEVLRPALELAVAVARRDRSSGALGRVPTGLRPYLDFARAPRPVQAAIRRVVEDDSDFRERVAEEADEDLVGRAGVLWLCRPDGWQDELDALRSGGSGAATGAGDGARAGRRAERERQARLAAEQEVRQVRARLDRLEERARRGTDRVTQLEAELSRLAADRDDAVRRLKEAEGRAVTAATERNELRRRIRALDVELAEARAAQPTVQQVPPGELEAALGAAEALLASLRELRDGGRPSAEATAPGHGPPAPPAGEASIDVRVPRPLPGGVRDDSVEAASYLLRLPGAVLLVDGYNVSMTAWAEVGVAEQRARLLGVLTELSARTGVSVDVVFDGDEVPVRTASRAPRGMRVRFSGPGTEADDVVLDLVGAYPRGRPVVVASSDGRVRDGARRRGANVVGAAQLLAAAGR